MSEPAVDVRSRRLSDRQPQVAPARLVAELVPPPRFADARFETYRPDPNEPSQAAALAAMRGFAERLAAPPPRKSLFRRAAPARAGRPGIYLDGGFGVGKTHLLTSLWHAAPKPAGYGTFVELTHLVGALGFGGTVDALGSLRLLCVDEFELDDPGDTVLVSSLLTRLVERGVALAATSNTLPDKLGEGRFAAEDFLREIQALSQQFDAVRVDGPDYRHRDAVDAPEPLDEAVVRDRVAADPTATADDWPTLLAHLATLHPSRYGALLDGVESVGLTGLTPVPDQNTALRVVVLVDRLYDRSLPVHASGCPVDQIFTPEMLAGGYRKKYLRALSRLTALARAAG
ncbi:cell division protein ZapE [Cryptosporangium aurantiacum]|uniref:Cell division protein ZapE n=1 Tax=Cryptosporangium aurantiacum TaxID=134849 RepID=A0A1M7R714_9ACTN|nr:cell division protein ZapE [Cryptosporangium aurantiacum]SHN42125.1 cell division protein ZapE [Cryptosporangium aurantiacum]